MTAQAVSSADRITALARFGYTSQEAEFLCLAALHGGYFLRRQVGRFFGCRDGGRIAQFASRVLALEHARSSTWRQNAQVYHLCARSLYEALGEPDNRNRRAHESSQIKNRIMGFDFVLDHLNVHYLATEREKISHFATTLNIDLEVLPHKLYRSTTTHAFTKRHFVDKYPVFSQATAPDGGAGSTGFCFVDEGMVSLSRFETYLADYRRLFQALPRFQLFYVAASETHFAGARAMFERFTEREIVGGSSRPVAAKVEELLAYFNLRRRFEDRDFRALGRLELIRLRDAREAFSNAEIEALYAIWNTSGDSGLREHLAEKQQGSTTVRGAFATVLLTHDYGLFGNGWPR